MGQRGGRHCDLHRHRVFAGGHCLPWQVRVRLLNAMAMPGQKQIETVKLVFPVYPQGQTKITWQMFVGGTPTPESSYCSFPRRLASSHQTRELVWSEAFGCRQEGYKPPIASSRCADGIAFWSKDSPHFGIFRGTGTPCVSLTCYHKPSIQLGIPLQGGDQPDLRRGRAATATSSPTCCVWSRRCPSRSVWRRGCAAGNVWICPLGASLAICWLYERSSYQVIWKLTNVDQRWPTFFAVQVTRPLCAAAGTNVLTSGMHEHLFNIMLSCIILSVTWKKVGAMLVLGRWFSRGTEILPAVRVWHF